MRIFELFAIEQQETNKRKILASPRFIKNVKKYRSFPGFAKSIQEFLVHWSDSAQNDNFNRSDMVQHQASDHNRLASPLRTTHLVHGKIIIAYQIQLTPAEIHLVDIGSIDDIIAKWSPPADGTAAYAARLDSGEYNLWSPPAPKSAQPVATAQKPETTPAPEPETAPEPVPVKAKDEPPPSKLSLFGRKALTDQELEKIQEDFLLWWKTDSKDFLRMIMQVKNGNLDEFMEWARQALGIKADDHSRDWIIMNSLRPRLQTVVDAILKIYKTQ
jgi:hypothetical protein